MIISESLAIYCLYLLIVVIKLSIEAFITILIASVILFVIVPLLSIYIHRRQQQTQTRQTALQIVYNPLAQNTFEHSNRDNVEQANIRRTHGTIPVSSSAVEETCSTENSNVLNAEP